MDALTISGFLTDNLAISTRSVALEDPESYMGVCKVYSRGSFPRESDFSLKDIVHPVQERLTTLKVNILIAQIRKEYILSVKVFVPLEKYLLYFHKHIHVPLSVYPCSKKIFQSTF